MKERITIVALDGIGGVAAIVLGLTFSGTLSAWGVPVGLLAGAGVGTILYRADRDGFAETSDELKAYGALVGGVLVLGAAVVLVGQATPSGAARAALIGGGGALVGYRFVYGVVRPVPEARLQRQRERAY